MPSFPRVGSFTPSGLALSLDYSKLMAKLQADSFNAAADRNNRAMIARNDTISRNLRQTQLLNAQKEQDATDAPDRELDRRIKEERLRGSIAGNDAAAKETRDANYATRVDDLAKKLTRNRKGGKFAFSDSQDIRNNLENGQSYDEEFIGKLQDRLQEISKTTRAEDAVFRDIERKEETFQAGMEDRLEAKDDKADKERLEDLTQQAYNYATQYPGAGRPPLAESLGDEIVKKLSSSDLFTIEQNLLDLDDTDRARADRFANQDRLAEQARQGTDRHGAFMKTQAQNEKVLTGDLFDQHLARQPSLDQSVSIVSGGAVAKMVGEGDNQTEGSLFKEYVGSPDPGHTHLALQGLEDHLRRLTPPGELSADDKERIVNAVANSGASIEIEKQMRKVLDNEGNPKVRDVFDLQGFTDQAWNLFKNVTPAAAAVKGAIDLAGRENKLGPDAAREQGKKSLQELVDAQTFATQEQANDLRRMYWMARNPIQAIDSLSDRK